MIEVKVVVYQCNFEEESKRIMNNLREDISQKHLLFSHDDLDTITFDVQTLDELNEVMVFLKKVDEVISLMVDIRF